MIAMHNKAIKATIRVNSKVVRAREVQRMTQESRDNKVGQARVIRKVNKVACPIVIARDKKAICPIVIASKASRKKLLQDKALRRMMMTRTQTNQDAKLQTRMRVLTAA